jgi:glycosyltransferase involved in cell wall biosynthesis
MNKFFDYLAGGKPILSNSVAGYDMIKKYQCGISQNFTSAEQYAECIKKMASLSIDEYQTCCQNARKAAAEYDFRYLSERLVNIINKLIQDNKS